jgi:hypothetical protein
VTLQLCLFDNKVKRAGVSTNDTLPPCIGDLPHLPLRNSQRLLARQACARCRLPARNPQVLGMNLCACSDLEARMSEQKVKTPS